VADIFPARGERATSPTTTELEGTRGNSTALAVISESSPRNVTAPGVQAYYCIAVLYSRILFSLSFSSSFFPSRGSSNVSRVCPRYRGKSSICALPERERERGRGGGGRGGVNHRATIRVELDRANSKFPREETLAMLRRESENRARASLADASR